MKEKKGAIEWSVGKLLSLVLGLVVIALITYGLVNNSFGPLTSKMGQKIDELAILLNIKEDNREFTGCFNTSIMELSDGPAFLESIGMQGNENAKFSVCRDEEGNSICLIDLKQKIQRLGYSSGNLIAEGGGSWFWDDTGLLHSDSVEARRAREVYVEGVVALKKANVYDLFLKERTPVLAFNGEDAGTIKWENNRFTWGGNPLSGYGSLKEFYDASTAGWTDDEVIYQVILLNGEKKSGGIMEFIRVYARGNEYDLPNLQRAFNAFAFPWVESLQLTSEELRELGRLIVEYNHDDSTPPEQLVRSQELRLDEIEKEFVEKPKSDLQRILFEDLIADYRKRSTTSGLNQDELKTLQETLEKLFNQESVMPEQSSSSSSASDPENIMEMVENLANSEANIYETFFVTSDHQFTSWPQQPDATSIIDEGSLQVLDLNEFVYPLMAFTIQNKEYAVVYDPSMPPLRYPFDYSSLYPLQRTDIRTTKLLKPSEYTGPPFKVYEKEGANWVEFADHRDYRDEVHFDEILLRTQIKEYLQKRCG